MRIHLRLFPRFLIYLILLTVTPVALVSHVVIKINKERLQQEVQRYHILLAGSFARNIDERLSTLQSQLSIALAAFKNPEVSWNERQQMLSALIDDPSSNFAIISAVSPRGQELMKVYNPTLSPELEKNPSLDSHQNFPLFQKFKSNGQEQTSVALKGQNVFVESYIPFETPLEIGRAHV